MHALGRIHTDSTEYLTLIKSMKSLFLFHTSVLASLLSPLVGVHEGGGSLKGQPFCGLNLSCLSQLIMSARHQTSVYTELCMGGLAGGSTSPEYPKLGHLCHMYHGSRDLTWLGHWENEVKGKHTWLESLDQFTGLIDRTDSAPEKLIMFIICSWVARKSYCLQLD